MAFTKALYYPRIDITNENWLKAAILFWDEISTIVPSSMKSPYQTNSSQYLHDIGVLTPIEVNSDQDCIKGLSADILNYLNTNEGFQLLTQEENGFHFQEDMPPKDLSLFFDLYPEKLAYEIQYLLRDKMTKDGLLRVDDNFGKFYMTLLASKICERRAIAPLTDSILTSNVSDLVRLDNRVQIIRREGEYDYRHRHRDSYINLSQGLLINMVIEGISIAEPSSLEDVILFKKRHQDELGRFRKNVENLTKGIPMDASLGQIKQMVEDVYVNEFLPGYNELKNALRGSKIKFVTGNLMKVSFISTCATSIPEHLFRLSVSNALYAGVGISLISSLVSYKVDKQAVLSNNPYSYLLAVNKGI